MLAYICAMKSLSAFIFVVCALFFPMLCFAADSTTSNLAAVFSERGFDGCFVLKQGRGLVRVNPQRAATGFRPASTFKIVNALVALESGAAQDTTLLLPWGGVVRQVPAWNADLTLEQAFRASAVWYFEELGRRNGRARLGAALRALSYGNADVRGSDRFWLDGGLRISAEEQVRCLARLFCGQPSAVPFSPRSLALVRGMMLLEKGMDKGEPWALYGKTGLALQGGSPGAEDVPVGWLVGFVERGGLCLPFALNLSARPGSGRGADELGPERMACLRELLARLGVLPAP